MSSARLEKLRERRLAVNVTQEMLAVLAGTTSKTVGKLERPGFVQTRQSPALDRILAALAKLEEAA